MSAEPNKITATVQEAEALQARGNTQGAIQLYRQWLKYSNSQYDWLIQFNLGILLRDGGDATGAQQAFQAVLKQKPDFVQAKTALELLLLHNHQLKNQQQNTVIQRNRDGINSRTIP